MGEGGGRGFMGVFGGCLVVFGGFLGTFGLLRGGGGRCFELFGDVDRGFGVFG